MDVQILIIGGVLFLISALLIYLISIYGMKEKTYEEVIEEQRKKNLELFGKSGSEADKKKEKKKKVKKPKVPTEKSSVTEENTTSVIDEEPEAAEPVHKMVELEIEPEIIDIDHPKTDSVRKRGGAKKNKPILSNREEKTPVSKERHAKEMFHVRAPPMDDLELKHDRERRQSGQLDIAEVEKPHKKAKSSAKEPKVEMSLPVEAEITAASASMVQAEPRKSKKNKQSASPVETSKDGAGNELREMLQTAKLSETEIQSLVEILVSKKGASAATVEWTKKSQKGDPVALLKKQLQEKEAALQEETTRSTSAVVTIRDLRTAVNMEKQRTQVVSEEVSALRQRMSASADQHVQEMRALHQQLEQFQKQQYDPSILQRLQDENQQLKKAQAYMSQGEQSSNSSGIQQQMKIMSEEMNKNVSKLTAAENGKQLLENKIARYEDQLHSQDKARQNAEQQLTEMTQQLQHLKVQQGGYNGELERRDREIGSLRAQLQSSRSMDQRNKDLESEKADTEAKVLSLQSQLNSAHTHSQQLQHSLQEEIEAKCRYEAELRVQQESQQGAASAGGDNQQLQQQLSQSEQALASKGQELASTVEELSKIQEELASQRNKNNSASLAEFSDIKQQLETTRKENEDLRGGCTEATRALTAAERAAEEITREHRQQLSHLHSKLSSEEKKLSELQAKYQQVEKDVQSRINGAKDSSTADNAKLQAQVLHYKTVLGDTEGILNKLQSSVESEERKWHAKVRTYEEQLAAATSELTALKSQNSSSAEKLPNGTPVATADETTEAASAGSELGTAL